MSKRELTILMAEKDEESSCMVVETEAGQDWISCAECRVGEMECDYLKGKWGINPCLYQRGVRLGRGLRPDPRDVVRIVENNIAVYNSMMDRAGPLLKAEREMLGKVLRLEALELESAKGMLYSKGTARQGLNRQDANEKQERPQGRRPDG